MVYAFSENRELGESVRLKIDWNSPSLHVFWIRNISICEIAESKTVTAGDIFCCHSQHAFRGVIEIYTGFYEFDASL